MSKWVEGIRIAEIPETWMVTTKDESDAWSFFLQETLDISRKTDECLVKKILRLDAWAGNISFTVYIKLNG